MRSCVVLWSIILSSLHRITAENDIFQGMFQQGAPPCFATTEPTGCHRTLAQRYAGRIRGVTNNAPNTLVFLFTTSSPDAAEPLHECGGQLPDGSTYNASADTEIFIHGWYDGVCRSAWMRECKDQVFLRAKRRKTAYNVILVDWTWGNTGDALVAALNSRIVGTQIGYVIKNIMRQTGVGPDKFHVIGHSFGAYAAGSIGRSVRGLRRITALDPAYFPFAHAPPRQRITYRDARLVDVIHSNGVNCAPLGIGDGRQLGHADFYPNGGKQQAGCYYFLLESLLKGDFFNGFGSLAPQFCSHLYVTAYYKLSINPDGYQYVGLESDSFENFRNQSFSASGNEWAVMGMDYELYHKPGGKRRKYFLTTTNSCPYYDDSYLKDRTIPFKPSCGK